MMCVVEEIMCSKAVLLRLRMTAGGRVEGLYFVLKIRPGRLGRIL